MAPIRGLDCSRFKLTAHAIQRFSQRVFRQKSKGLEARQDVRSWALNNLDRCRFNKTEAQQRLRLVTII